MSRNYLSTMFATLGQLAAEMLAFLQVYPLLFCNFSLNSYVFFNILEFVSKIFANPTIQYKECVLTTIWHQVCCFRVISS